MAMSSILLGSKWVHCLEERTRTRKDRGARKLQLPTLLLARGQILWVNHHTKDGRTSLQSVEEVHNWIMLAMPVLDANCPRVQPTWNINWCHRSRMLSQVYMLLQCDNIQGTRHNRGKHIQEDQGLCAQLPLAVLCCVLRLYGQLGTTLRSQGQVRTSEWFPEEGTQRML